MFLDFPQLNLPVMSEKQSFVQKTHNPEVNSSSPYRRKVNRLKMFTAFLNQHFKICLIAVQILLVVLFACIPYCGRVEFISRIHLESVLVSTSTTGIHFSNTNGFESTMIEGIGLDEVDASNLGFYSEHLFGEGEFYSGLCDSTSRILNLNIGPQSKFRLISDGTFTKIIMLNGKIRIEASLDQPKKPQIISHGQTIELGIIPESARIKLVSKSKSELNFTHSTSSYWQVDSTPNARLVFSDEVDSIKTSPILNGYINITTPGASPYYFHRRESLVLEGVNYKFAEMRPDSSSLLIQLTGEADDVKVGWKNDTHSLKPTFLNYLLNNRLITGAITIIFGILNFHLAFFEFTKKSNFNREDK